jgi:hypothetical protein
MKAIKQGKIVLDKNMKSFRGVKAEVIDSFEDIQLENLFSIEYPDADIIKQYDPSYRKNIDIWNIEIIIQTKSF